MTAEQRPASNSDARKRAAEVAERESDALAAPDPHLWPPTYSEALWREFVREAQEEAWDAGWSAGWCERSSPLHSRQPAHNPHRVAR
jgi:hypothetical protein